MTVPRIRVYSRPGCHLCEELIEALLPLVRGRAIVDVHNVDERKDWQQQFGNRIPVVEVEGRWVCEATLDRQALLAAIAGRDIPMAAS